jgi:enamine deaminase RidA (YjgF/YER057c/UK114 family)
LSLVPGGLEAETHQMFRHIESILKQAGGNLDNIVKCTVYLAEMSDWPAFNAIYAGYFRGPLPARSALAAKELAFGARVEMECIAVVE